MAERQGPDLAGLNHTVETLLEEEAETCAFLHVHEEAVARVKALLPDDASLSRLADLFRIFADETRIRILYVLFEEEVCVCDIATLLSMTQSAVSHQLRILKQAHLVRSRRMGKTVFYSLADEHVRILLHNGTEHICED